MNLVVFEAEEWEATACHSLAHDHHLTCTRDPLTETNAGDYPEVEVVTTFVHSRLTADVLGQLPKLKLVATRSTGYDHVDLAFCLERGISVANVPSYGDVTVAEHVFALLLALSRNLFRSVQLLREGRFDQGGLRGFDLYGKTLGVIGTGRIGRRVIEIGRGFGMSITAHDRVPDEEFARRMGFSYCDLETLLQSSDVVSLHVPATPDTEGLIGARQLRLMKKEAVLINTARGNVIDVAALVEALTDGRLRGAGLDVLPQEPLMRDEAEVFRSTFVDESGLRQMIANHVLMSMPNVVVTPHVAYNTAEARRRIIDTTIENIVSFSQGHPKNLVT